MSMHSEINFQKIHTSDKSPMISARGSEKCPQNSSTSISFLLGTAAWRKKNEFSKNVSFKKIKMEIRN